MIFSPNRLGQYSTFFFPLEYFEQRNPALYDFEYQDLDKSKLISSMFDNWVDHLLSDLWQYRCIWKNKYDFDILRSVLEDSVKIWYDD